MAIYLAPGRRCLLVAVGCFGVMDSEEACAVPALGASYCVVSVYHMFPRGDSTVHRSHHSCLTFYILIFLDHGNFSIINVRA